MFLETANDAMPAYRGNRGRQLVDAVQYDNDHTLPDLSTLASTLFWVPSTPKQDDPQRDAIDFQRSRILSLNILSSLRSSSAKSEHVSRYHSLRRRAFRPYCSRELFRESALRSAFGGIELSHALYLYRVVAVDITYQQAPVKTAGSATSPDMEPHRCSFSSMSRMCHLVTFPRVHTLPASFLHNSLTRIWSQRYAGEDGVSPWRANPTTAATVLLRPRAAAGGGYSSRQECQWLSYKPEHYVEKADRAQPVSPVPLPPPPRPLLVAAMAPSPPASRRSWLTP